MILVYDSAGHGFVLVLIELSGYAPTAPPAWERGVENFRKVFAGGESEILILVGDVILLGWEFT